MAYLHLNGATAPTWKLFTPNNQTVFMPNPPPIPNREAQGSVIIQRVGTGAWEYLQFGLPHPDSAAAHPVAAPAPASQVPMQSGPPQQTNPTAAAPSNQNQPLVIQDTTMPLIPGAPSTPVQTMAPQAEAKSGGSLWLALAVLAAGMFAGG